MSVLPAYVLVAKEEQYIPCERSIQNELEFKCRHILGKGVRISIENEFDVFQLCEMKVYATQGRI